MCTVCLLLSESHIVEKQGLQMICGHTFVARGMVIFLGRRLDFVLRTMARVFSWNDSIAAFGELTQ
jgi:hypothetical protein